MSFIFDKLAPPPFNKLLKYALNHFLSLWSIPVQKTFAEVLKTWYFPYCAFWPAGQWEGLLPPRYATRPGLFSTAALPSAYKIISVKIYWL